MVTRNEMRQTRACWVMLCRGRGAGPDSLGGKNRALLQHEPDVLPKPALFQLHQPPSSLLLKAVAASCHSPCCSWHVVYLMARSARCCTRLLCVCFQSELPTACLVRHKAVFLKTALWRYNCYTTNCPCFGCNFGCVSMPMKTWPRSRQQDRHLPESLMSLHSLSLLFHPQTTPDVFSVLYISLHFLAFAGVKQRCSVFHPGFFYSTQLLCNPSRSRV